MPRQKRVEFEGAVYHVMARGNRGGNIVEDDQDRKLFLETLREVVGQTGWEVYAFALMSNHYHLAFKTPEANLVKGMTWFQNTFTKRINGRHKQYGHLFSGRYKAVNVEEGSYLRTLIHYIHLNPLRAGMIPPVIEEMKGYRWTSVADYFNPKSLRRDFLAVEKGLSYLDIPDTPIGRDKFLDWTARLAGKEEDDYSESIRNGWVMGTEAFLKEMNDRLEIEKEDGKNGYAGGQLRGHGIKVAHEILARELKRLDLKPEDLYKLKKNDGRKAEIAIEIRKKTTVNADWIGEHLVMGSRGAISNAIRKFKDEKR